MWPLILQAMVMASRPDSTEVLTESHLTRMKKRPPPKTKELIPKKKVRRWRGVFEHKDTPIHHH